MHETMRFAAVGWVAVLMVAPGASAYAEIEEIVVTSRKTEERLQDVPIAITVLGAQQIQEARIESFDDVASITPGLNSTATVSHGTKWTESTVPKSAAYAVATIKTMLA